MFLDALLNYVYEFIPAVYGIYAGMADMAEEKSIGQELGGQRKKNPCHFKNIIDYLILVVFLVLSVVYQVLFLVQTVFIQLVSSLELAKKPFPPMDTTVSSFEFEVKLFESVAEIMRLQI